MIAAQLKKSNYYCDICKVMCGAEINYKGHLKSEKHRQRSGNFECYYCKTWSINEKSYNDHIQTAVHQRLEIKFFETLKKELTTRKDGESVGRIFLEKIPAVATKAQEEYYCNLCDCSMDKTNVDSHLCGHRHRSFFTEEINRVLGAGETSSDKKDETSKAGRTLSLCNEENQLPVNPTAVGLSSVNFTKLPEVVDHANQGTNTIIQPVGEIYLERLAVNGEIEELYCKLCDCWIFGKEEKEAHLKNPRHCIEFDKKNNEKAVKDLEIKPKQQNYFVVAASKKPYCCGICNVTSHNEKEWTEHVNSNKHWRAAQNIFCLCCNMKIKDEISYNKHIKKEKHLTVKVKFFKLIERELNTKKQGEPVGQMYLERTTDLDYYCSLCDCHFDKTNVDTHFGGRQHRSWLVKEVDRVLCGESSSTKSKAPLKTDNEQRTESKSDKSQPPADPAVACPSTFEHTKSDGPTATEQVTLVRTENGSASPIITQVTELWTGQRAKDLKVMVYKQNLDGTGSIDIAMKRTGADGMTPSLLSDYPWTEGCYKITFDTGEYFRNCQMVNVTFFFVEISFPVTDVNERYDIQVFISPHEYSINRKILTSKHPAAECPLSEHTTFDGFTTKKQPVNVASPITTQVTESWTGQRAKDLKVMVYKQNLDGTGNIDIAMKRTGIDGTTPSLVSDYPWTTGYYKITFDLGEYFRNRQVANVTFPLVVVYLSVTDINERYNLQARISPHEYTISRIILEGTK